MPRMEDVVLTRVEPVKVEPVKLCKDCRWVERGWFGRVHERSECRHEKSALRLVSLVVGAVACVTYLRAGGMRSKSGRCGPDAKLFEPRR